MSLVKELVSGKHCPLSVLVLSMAVELLNVDITLLVLFLS